jgi:hypothetical protein
MLLSGGDFLANRRFESHAFLRGVNGISFTLMIFIK